VEGHQPNDSDDNGIIRYIIRYIIRLYENNCKFLEGVPIFLGGSCDIGGSRLCQFLAKCESERNKTATFVDFKVTVHNIVLRLLLACFSRYSAVLPASFPYLRG
jgi:hypothetical protein